MGGVTEKGTLDTPAKKSRIKVMTLPASKVSPLLEWRAMSSEDIPRISDAEISRKYLSLGVMVRRSLVASMMQRH